MTVIGVGIGSAAFHGPMPAWGRFARATPDARLWILIVGGVAIGALLDALGRTDGALCDPDSPVQLHALWHVLTAFVLWLYGTAALGPREQARPKIRA